MSLQLLQMSYADWLWKEKWLTPECDFIIFFPPSSRDCTLGFEDILNICRDMGMSPYWPTMCVLPNKHEGYMIAFNTQYQLPTYLSLHV